MALLWFSQKYYVIWNKNIFSYTINFSKKKSCTLVSWSDSQLVYINTKNNEGASESVVSKKGNHLQHFILLELVKKVTNAICQ